MHQFVFYVAGFLLDITIVLLSVAVAFALLVVVNVLIAVFYTSPLLSIIILLPDSLFLLLLLLLLTFLLNVFINNIVYLWLFANAAVFFYCYY